MTDKDELEQRHDWRAFLSWWNAHEQLELRYSCAQGWGWKIWQASRAAIEIELPQPISEFNKVNGYVPPEAAAYDEALADCAEVIRESGLRVAGSNSLQTADRLLDDALNHLKMDNPVYSQVARARNIILRLIDGWTESAQQTGVSDEDAG